MERSPELDEAEYVAAQARLFDTPKQAVIGTDAAGCIVYWSRGATELYDWSATEVAGKNIVEVTPSDLTREEARRIMRLLQKGRSWSGEFHVRRRNGTEFLASVSDIPVRDARGRLIGIIGVSSPVNPGQD